MEREDVYMEREDVYMATSNKLKTSHCKSLQV